MPLLQSFLANCAIFFINSLQGSDRPIFGHSNVLEMPSGLRPFATGSDTDQFHDPWEPGSAMLWSPGTLVCQYTTWAWFTALAPWGLDDVVQPYVGRFCFRSLRSPRLAFGMASTRAFRAMRTGGKLSGAGQSARPRRPCVGFRCSVIGRLAGLRKCRFAQAGDPGDEIHSRSARNVQSPVWPYLG